MSVIKTKDSDGNWVPLNVLRGKKGDPGKDATMPVGFEYFQTNPNIRAGSLPLTGGVYSRTIYADLWAWVQKQTGYLITEAEWQVKAAVNNGAVPFYSDGDGSTTFRVPALTVWCKGANGDEAIGDYLADTFASHNHNVSVSLSEDGAHTHTRGTMNITGAASNDGGAGILGNVSGNVSKSTGAFYKGTAYSWRATTVQQPGCDLCFDASRAWTGETSSNGAHTHTVTMSETSQGGEETRPKTIIGIYCVIAFGVTTSSGAVSLDDIKAVLDGTDETLESITARIKEAEELFNKGALPVGFEYIQNNPTPRLGSLPLTGDTYSRKEYSALWEWAQSQAGYVIAESDWQTKKADNVSVPYYSDGDGSTTFRVPNLTVRTYVVAINSDKVEGSISLEALYSGVSEAKNVISAASTIRLVGEQWVSVHGIIPKGGVPYCGQEVSRAMYADLWQWVNDNSLVITEAEWQALNTSQNGNVTKYSDGDGSSTFRMPAIKGYVKGASSQSESGAYTPEGLPNITASFVNESYPLTPGADWSVSGALRAVSKTASQSITVGGANQKTPRELHLDASRSSTIYGNSDHVTPETSVVLFGVYAFGAIVETGELDATTLATGLARVEANLEAKLDKPVRYVTETWSSGTEWYTKYNDGWIEQGGQTANASGGTVTLYVAHKDANYTVVMNTTGSADYFHFSPSVSSRTETTFNWHAYQGVHPRTWMSCGY